MQTRSQCPFPPLCTASGKEGSRQKPVQSQQNNVRTTFNVVLTLFCWLWTGFGRLGRRWWSSLIKICTSKIFIDIFLTIIIKREKSKRRNICGGDRSFAPNCFISFESNPISAQIFFTKNPSEVSANYAKTPKCESDEKINSLNLFGSFSPC